MKTAILLFAVSILAWADDNASVLARILAEKGTISAAELAQVESVAPGDRLQMLTALLENRGLLTPAEVARVNGQPEANAPLVAHDGGRGNVQPDRSAPKVPASSVNTTGPVSVDSLRHDDPQVPAQPTTAPGAPVTARGRFPVSVYGTVLFNSIFDTAQMNITDIPLFPVKPDALGDDKSFSMTARQTRLGLRFDGPELIDARLSGQVEIDFLGGKAPFGNGVDMDLLRLRLAFGRLDWDHWSLEGGQDWVIFAPLNPTSYAQYAIPSMSASGNLWIRLPQLRVEYHNANLLAQFAAIDPNMGDYNTAVFSATRPVGIGERGRAPGAEARFAYTAKQDDRDFTIGISGHYGHGKNSGTVGNITEQLPLNSWGAAIDFSLPFTKVFNLSGEAYTGRALGIFSGESGEAIEPVGIPGDVGVRSSGGWAQAEFNFTPKWQVNLVYGIDDPSVHDLPVGARGRNQSYMGNLIWKYTPHFNIAWEYRQILTNFVNLPSATLHGGTANLAFIYLF
jgi:hypothetical protein